MANFTKFFKLRKPLPEEFYNIEEHNQNMDIIDDALNALSGDSGVVISPDEPETGDVWIDTDDDDVEGGGGSGSGGAVTSVNGQTGAVNLTAKDVDAYTVGETYNKVEINNLMNNKAEGSHKHSASDINSGILPVSRGGTGNNAVDSTPTSGSTKMVTSGGVFNALSGKANGSHKHSTDDINGLEGFINSLGFGRVATGSYIGDDVVGRTLTLPFTPSVVMIVGKTAPVSPRYFTQMTAVVQGSTVSLSAYATAEKAVSLSGNVLTFYAGDRYKPNDSAIYIYASVNHNGYEYTWVAIA